MRPEITQFWRSGRNSTCQKTREYSIIGWAFIILYIFEGSFLSFCWLLWDFDLTNSLNRNSVLLSNCKKLSYVAQYFIPCQTGIVWSFAFILSCRAWHGAIWLGKPTNMNAKKGGLYTGHLNLYRAQTTLPMRLNNMLNTLKWWRIRAVIIAPKSYQNLPISAQIRKFTDTIMQYFVYTAS
jgi:hypothetical protein